MNTIRFCFTATVALLAVAIGGRVASCMDVVPGQKCCPKGQLYDPEVRFCRPDGHGDKYEQRMLNRLRRGFRVAANAMLKMQYKLPYCDSRQVLVDVPTVELRGLMKAHPSPIELPLEYCFDLTPSKKLVARTCRSRNQYCGQVGYTCVNKCCCLGRIFVDDPNRKWYRNGFRCNTSETPFTLSAYETDAGGSPVGRSNNTVLPYYDMSFQIYMCNSIQIMDDRFTLTTDGNLYLIHKDIKLIIHDQDYCLENYAEDGPPEAADLRAFTCSNFKPPVGFIFWVTYPPSVMCLVLTLIVYAIQPYLRNAHGYYVMFYMACQLVRFVTLMIDGLVNDDKHSPWCIPFGYFSLFATLTTCCWLNVICFDIYWMLRYNNSTNRNTSKSVRTIMYHIYCWGLSSIIVSTGYLFQNSQNETLQELAPNIGHDTCNFYRVYTAGTITFYVLPTCVLLAANLIMFVLTAIHCSMIKSELNKFRRTDSKTEMFLVHKEKFVMSIKLFLVFGIPFSLSMLTIIFPIPWRMNMIIKTISDLQGVFLFIIFVAKRKVLMDLKKKFRRPIVRSELTPLNNITGSS